MRCILILITGCFLLSSCKNAEIGNGKDVAPEAIYYDYKIWGGEEEETVSVMLQYRFGGENGTTLVLDTPSKVELDGRVLTVDSAGMAGAFYEATVPAREFVGRHRILFTDKEGKKHEEVFNYQPFTITASLPEKIRRDSLTVQLAGLEGKTIRARLVLTDTALTTTGINEEIKITNGQVKLMPRYWRALKNGPITLDIYQETEAPLKNGTKEGGRLSITYGLKRQFELVD